MKQIQSMLYKRVPVKIGTFNIVKCANIVLMDDEDVETNKYMLRTRQAPVVVIYNN